MKAALALESGEVFVGTSVGVPGEVTGEVVFHTGMTGYQEIFTDPSYRGQIVTMTYPHIGNYGVNHEDLEAAHPAAAGIVIRELSAVFSNWRAKEGLEAFLQRHRLMGISGIDTRALTKHLREQGALRGVISTQDLQARRLVAKAKASPTLVGQDLVREVTCDHPYRLGPHEVRGIPLSSWEDERGLQVGVPHVGVMDFGVKVQIQRCLQERGCIVTVVPAKTTAQELMHLRTDGVVLSNGPGDPAAVTYAVETIRQLLHEISQGTLHVPLFGICLGHQLLGLALGGQTYKLKFGHHGANHPVKDLTTGKVEITSQNHGFAVDINSLPSGVLEVTHLNLNDQTVEGMRHRQLPVFSVQYHPEASPGPHDSRYLFDRFLQLIRGETAPHA
ncbi:MAG: glutamine-hydrolyzing carbamoyl-phosphate synthase small subunit [Elusimicrobia bacterium]|nr:glutamine-hydrolyzing carbamoyl-phosphate synthase small subunit [Elusimicrobiota bacterium]